MRQFTVLLSLLMALGCDDGGGGGSDGGTRADGSTVKACQLILDPTQLQLDLTNRTSEAFLKVAENTSQSIRLYTACIDLDPTCRTVQVKIPLAALTGKTLTYPRFTFNWNSGQSTTPFIAVTLKDPSGTTIDKTSKDWDIRDDRSHRIYHYPNKPLVFGTWDATLTDQRTATGRVQVMIAVSARCSGSGCPR